MNLIFPLNGSIRYTARTRELTSSNAWPTALRGPNQSLDRQHYVDPKELEIWAVKCPIRRYRQKLLDDGVLNEAQILAIDQDTETRVTAAVNYGDASPYPGPETFLTDVFVQPTSA